MQVTGYTHKFIVDVNGQNIIFEPDEEGSYRAMLNYEELNNAKNIDSELLKGVSESIQDILK